ncbi:MAG TPA: SMP-30/gluconolactonase/LRE family protein [Caulobacteraceae bacterium]|jgi:sugar lactone lactonase YvrE|nr:SMP-30/gluconolactonase/LRE family protein [Caulobacteraceae bacterium]
METDHIAVAASRKNVLGEGPVWDCVAGRVYWVDIRSRLIEWLNPATGDSGLWTLDCRPSALAPRVAGGLLVATDKGLALFDTDKGALEPAHNPEPHLPMNRSNDGHTDAQGRFWLGTMNDAESADTGAVYRLDPDWTCTRMIENLCIPNTLVTSPDGRTLYVAASKSAVIWAYDLDPETGALGSRRLFADTKADKCSPDGSAMDAEGCLWNCQWGGWRIVRYRPDGSVDRIVKMPVEQPSSCAFGGPDLATLYVTSARDGLSELALDSQPLAGCLFSFDPGVNGFPQTPFGG